MSEAIGAYAAGRIALRELADLLSLDVWGAHDLLAAEGVAIAQGELAETAADLAAVLAELAEKP